MANKEWIKKGADGLSFGERLGDLIANNKTNATALAKEAGLQQSAISDYLNKDRAPDCGTIYALARHFHVSADYLLGLEPIPTTDLTTKDIHRKTGLSEENISRLLKAENHTSGLSYADFVNMCLDVAHIVRGDFYLLTLAFKEKMEYEEKQKDAPALSIEEIWESFEQAETMAKKRGYALLDYTGTIEFYARNIANALEKYLLGVFNHGND